MMPLDNATSGLTGQLPVNQSVNQVQSTASGAKKNVKPRKLNQTTKDLTEPVVPGEFPSDDALPKKKKSIAMCLSQGCGPPSYHVLPLYSLKLLMSLNPGSSIWCPGCFLRPDKLRCMKLRSSAPLRRPLSFVR